ncbi:MAG: SAM-dependent methyltransferase [Candidatus Aenigmarchaeota archaeon]|nr:SAM-dependent methyltransferase [Candidatus Aenigmarchaeota archaeon]
MGNIKIKCKICGKIMCTDDIYVVDGENVCKMCMHENKKPFMIYPIGYVKNDLKRKSGSFGNIGKEKVSRIELFSSQMPFMYMINDEKHLTIVYYLNKRNPIRSVFKRGLDGKEVGIFASRTPDRPSGIAIQEVTLLKVDGTTLYVEGLDAINDSPVLDIKLGRKSIDG